MSSIRSANSLDPARPHQPAPASARCCELARSQASAQAAQGGLLARELAWRGRGSSKRRARRIFPPFFFVRPRASANDPRSSSVFFQVRLIPNTTAVVKSNVPTPSPCFVSVRTFFSVFVVFCVILNHTSACLSKNAWKGIKKGYSYRHLRWKSATDEKKNTGAHSDAFDAQVTPELRGVFFSLPFSQSEHRRRGGKGRGQRFVLYVLNRHRHSYANLVFGFRLPEVEGVVCFWSQKPKTRFA